jgi:hypothetical protein
LDKSHNFGSIENVMTILEFQKKGRHMNTLEKYYIYKEAIHDNHLNDQYTVNQNKTVKIVSKNEA